MEDLIQEIEAKVERAIEKIHALEKKIKELEESKENDTQKLQQLANKLTSLDVEVEEGQHDQYSTTIY